MTTELDPEYLSHEYRLARLRIVDLVSSLSDEDSNRPVPACPAWTVRDLLAHVAGIATEISEGNPPSGDSQAWVDAIVDDRRSQSIDELIDEWQLSGPVFEKMAATTKRLSVPLSYDTVVHEHDLRHALGVPGARDSSGVLAAMHVGVWLMTNDLKRHGFGSVTFHAGGRDWHCGEGDLRLSLDLDVSQKYVTPVWELLRLTGSRRSLAQMMRYDWQGDSEDGIAALLHMDMPASDLDE